jgi:HSP20 family molecular chaperone IbpA
MAEETKLQVQEAEKQEVESSDAERTRSGAAFIPRADIYETEDAVYLVCDLPGVSEDSVDITLEENVLTINGYVDFTPPEDYQLAYAEYRVGDYQRRFALSNEIDQNQIEANLKDGVLRLTLPKAKPESRKISIQAG